MAGFEDAVIVAQGDMAHVRELREVLAREGIDCRAVRPPEGRGSS